MKWNHKILLIIVFLASAVHLNEMKSFSKLKEDQVLKIYKKSFHLFPADKYEFKGCMREWMEIPKELESKTEIKEDLALFKMSFQDFMHSAHTLYHLIECVSKLDDFLPKKVENDTKKYKKCPQYTQLYEFDRDDMSIMYSCFLHHFECDDKGNELKCFFNYLDLNLRKVNYSDIDVTASEIEEETKSNGKFLNEKIEFLIFLEQHSKPEIYAILNHDVKVNIKNDEDYNCPICLDSMVNYTKLPCKHKFHEECISNWGKNHDTCPICRGKFSLNLKKDDNKKDNKKDNREYNPDLDTEYIKLLFLENNHKLFEYGKRYFEASHKERDIIAKLYDEVFDIIKNKGDQYYFKKGFNYFLQKYLYFNIDEYTPTFAETKDIAYNLKQVYSKLKRISKDYELSKEPKKVNNKQVEDVQNYASLIIDKIQFYKTHLNTDKDYYYLEESYLTTHHKNLWKIELEKI